MPTYEYKCDACGHDFEKFQTMSSASIKKCPVCGKNKVRRLIGSGAGLIFKGSGFYITDYREQAYKDKAQADTAPKTETKSDVKTEAPSPAASGNGDAKGSTENKPAAKTETPAPAGAAAKTESKPVEKSARKKKTD